jgi:Fur family ferric uptake transcriptional regulator
MMTPNPKLADILRRNGLNITQQRQTVFGLLGTNESLSMNELVGQSAGLMDRASVYRIVSVFEKLGIAQRINLGWKYKIELSDQFAGHHHHLVCTKCQTILPIDTRNLEGLIDQVAAQNGFTALTHQIEIQGLCDKCKNKSAK